MSVGVAVPKKTLPRVRHVALVPLIAANLVALGTKPHMRQHGLRKIPEPQGRRRNRGPMNPRALIGGFAAALALIALPAGAQTADEHAGHHPGGGAPDALGARGMPPGATMPPLAAPTDAPGTARSAPMGSPATSPGAPVAPGMAGGGMGEMMGKMMAPASPGGCMGGNCGSGAAAKTPIYPSLMTLPAITPEKRAEIDALASQQINEGLERHAKGAASLGRATQAGDDAAMQESVGMMRESLDELGAGIAARRVLLEGKAPRNLALDWFKREMNLASPVAREEPRAFLGIPPFHLFTMVLLIAFALAMVAMYFFKMRRTAALFGRIGPGSGTPPPGSSPPLAGEPGSSAPVVPAPAEVPAPASATPTASATSPGGSVAVPVLSSAAENAPDKPPAALAVGGSPAAKSSPPP